MSCFVAETNTRVIPAALVYWSFAPPGAASAGRSRERDQLIADLIENQYRLTDIADVLGMTTRAVSLARNRARSV